jgi:hypothetical protein
MVALGAEKDWLITHDKNYWWELSGATKQACLKTFILFSSSRNTQPEEPTKGKTWTQALELSEAIVDSVLQMVQIKTFLEWSATETLSL